MTAVTVRKEIKAAVANHIVSKTEVGKITAATGKSVSNAEAREIFDMYSRATARHPMVARPGVHHLRFGKGAGDKLNTFFIKAKMPVGENAAAVRAQIEDALSRVRLMPLASEPNVAKLIPVYLPTPEGMQDGPVRTAHFDVQKQSFYLNVRDPWRPDGVNQWFGPIGVNEAPPPAPEDGPVAYDTLERVRRAFNDLTSRALIDWDSLPEHMPLGSRLVEAEALPKDDAGFTYAAIFTVGALSPTAPQRDPNLMDEVWVKRSGNGPDRILGPIDMTEVDGGVTAETLKKLRDALDTIPHGGSTWMTTPPLIAPGASITTVPVRKQPGFDTYSYGAMLVLGAGGDVNQPQSVVFTRSGGQMGTTMYALGGTI